MSTLIAQAESTGLDPAVAARRLAEDGPNSIARPRTVPVWRRVVGQLLEPLVALLLAALVVTVLLRDITDAAVIGLVVVVNTAIGVVQEVRAERAIAALDRLTAPTARVVRGGDDLMIAAAELVVGDVVRVEAGDIVPADLRLVSAHQLNTDESALTGESEAVPHDAGDELLAGTVVVTGRARGVVLRTGSQSALGHIATLVHTTAPGPTPLQRRLSALGRILGGAIVALSALVFVLGIIAGRPAIAMAITAVSLVVAAVPESLPAVVTLALALGARRMATHRAIPRRLQAVEALGAVTVVASDKTGTLTEGRMSVRWATDALARRHEAVGEGYDPTGETRGPDGIAASPPPELTELARAGLLCSDATLAPPTADEPHWQAVGDPMEAALVTFACRCGLDPAAERARLPRIAEAPFDQQTRRMSTVHRGNDGTITMICKGAPEAVLTPALIDGDTGPAMAAAQELADAGLRVIAVATAQAPAGHPPSPDSMSGLRLLGVIGIGDPVRRSAVATAVAFDQAGVRFILITGDHPATATAIGAQVGIWHEGDPVVVGGLSRASQSIVDDAQVFARTQPAQKLDIIAGLQDRGHVVAMVGDGVNDAPALRRADIGIAMGGGTEVARQAADLILVDDNLATLTSAIGEGRRIFDNIRRFLHYALAGGVAEILVMLCGPFLGLAVPLLPAQILWINLLTHGLPGVAMGAEPAEPDVLSRPPRSPHESVLGGGLGRRVVGTGFALTLASLGAGVLADLVGWPWQSTVFMVLGLGQLGIAIVVRATRRADSGHNVGLGLAILLSAALQVAGVALRPLRTLLGTQTLSLTQLIACGAFAAAPALLVLGHRHIRPDHLRAT